MEAVEIYTRTDLYFAQTGRPMLLIRRKKKIKRVRQYFIDK